MSFEVQEVALTFLVELGYSLIDFVEGDEVPPGLVHRFQTDVIAVPVFVDMVGSLN